MLDIIVAFLIVSGGFFCFAAGLGVLRLPDLLIRMHASTKAGPLGSGLILAAVAVAFLDGTVIARAVAAIAFLVLTSPVSAHLIGRAAFRTGVPMKPDTQCEPGVADALHGRRSEQPPQ